MKQSLPIIVALVLFGYSCNEDDEGMEVCVEQKKESCVVTFELNPVCGCNGVTYENHSIAECNGIGDYIMGACN